MISTRHLFLVVALLAAAGACSDDTDGAAEESPSTLTLVAYSAFAPPAALTTFTETTGIAVEVLDAGDTGTMVAKAVLTAGTPEGDVLWGIDDPSVARALDGNVFVDHAVAAETLAALDPQLIDYAPTLTPVDVADVCVNVDIAWFVEHDVALPTELADLAEPAYRDLTVVENPASSSPGLAFLLATVAEFGPPGEPAGGTAGIEAYWTALRDNGVAVVDDWDTAYYGSFTAGGGGGDRPIVVSYATSPPVTIIFAEDPKPTEPTTASLPDTCYRVAEYAGVLAGTKYPTAAGRLVDFLVSAEFQAQLPETNFVYPARTDVALPQLFIDFAPRADAPLRLDPATVAVERDAWIEAFTDAVIR